MACQRCGNPNVPGSSAYCLNCLVDLVGASPAGATAHSTVTTGDVEDGATVAGTLIRRADNVHVENATIHQVAAPVPKPDVHQLRAPVADFTGRQVEIDTLVAALTQTDASTAPLAAVRGLAGSGKTTLALVVANHVKDTYPDAQIVLDLRGASATPLTPAQALQAVIRAFEPEQAAMPPDDLAALKAHFLSLLSGKRALILADDARDEVHVADLVPPAGCALLVTSRQRLQLPGMVLVDLGPLAPTDAEALLLAIATRIGGASKQLAELCGHLPLALRVSATQLARTPITVARYVEQLAEERTRLLAIPDPSDPSRSVGAALLLSYNTLPADAQTVLAQLSVFAGSFDREAAQAVVDIAAGADAVEEQLALLYERSLVDWDEPTDRFSLHDLVRTFAAGQLEDDAAVRLRHARHYATVADAAEKLFRAGGAATLAGLALFDREHANVDAGWSWARKHDASETTDRLLLAYADATVNTGALRYHMRLARIPQLLAALGAARRLGDRGSESRALGNLGNAYHSLGEVRTAITYHEQVLTSTRESGDRGSEGNALGNLGNAYYSLGEVRRARDYYEQALAIAREIGDRASEGTTLGNLGIAYYSLGEVHMAIGYCEQALAVAREIGDRGSEGRTLGYLGIAYSALGEVRRAIAYHEQVRTIMREIGDRGGEGHALGNLGVSYRKLGEVHRAIECYQQVRTIMREIGDRAGEGIALHNLANASHSLGEVGKAIGYYEQHLVIAREISDRRGEASTNWKLGNLLVRQGEAERGLELMQICVDLECQMDDPRAEQDAAHLEQLRQQLARGGVTSASDNTP